jgi:membrane protein insertase Oxa1/YidC/SpoIIIJ
LTVADPYGILPMINASLAFMNTKIALNQVNKQFEETIAPFKMMLLLSPLLSLPIQMFFPASFNIYWIIIASF